MLPWVVRLWFGTQRDPGLGLPWPGLLPAGAMRTHHRAGLGLRGSRTLTPPSWARAPGQQAAASRVTRWVTTQRQDPVREQARAEGGRGTGDWARSGAGAAGGGAGPEPGSGRGRNPDAHLREGPPQLGRGTVRTSGGNFGTSTAYGASPAAGTPAPLWVQTAPDCDYRPWAVAFLSFLPFPQRSSEGSSVPLNARRHSERLGKGTCGRESLWLSSGPRRRRGSLRRRPAPPNLHGNPKKWVPGEVGTRGAASPVTGHGVASIRPSVGGGSAGNQNSAHVAGRAARSCAECGQPPRISHRGPEVTTARAPGLCLPPLGEGPTLPSARELRCLGGLLPRRPGNRCQGLSQHKCALEETLVRMRPMILPPASAQKGAEGSRLRLEGRAGSARGSRQRCGSGAPSPPTSPLPRGWARASGPPRAPPEKDRERRQHTSPRLPDQGFGGRRVTHNPPPTFPTSPVTARP